ncbi:MAG: class I tRNA ligase family protein [Candidatus Moranbacteria bacterium]|nr:class I tRNA ligase family protein [Candidatus Moranbacteria bacterium]
MFPYPSAEGLHIGNFYAFTSVDVMAKYMRLKGFDVYEPIGWDAFGIHSENYALKIGQTPEKMLQRTIKNFRHQLQAAGLSCDWTREVNTTDPEYYKWTQWIFTKLFEKGMAYQKEALVNWCPDCKTVLADEQIEAEGVCERCKTTVEKRKMKQWFFRITAYAERLLEGLETMNWSEITKSAQRNWIGKSEGTIIKFKIEKNNFIEVFTTRVDTLFGCTYVVLSPEHELSLKIATPEKKKEVEKYIKKSSRKSEMDRKESKVKTGVFTGAYALNPVNNEKVPIWVADYVLAGYGTGAVMAVPTHDERDFEFAKKYKLPIRPVVVPDLGKEVASKKINKIFAVVEEINKELTRKKIKVWFNGTIGVIGFLGKIFDIPQDVDCGVQEKDFEKAKAIIEKVGYSKVLDKKNNSFRVSVYRKNDLILEIGTFDHDLGEETGLIENVKFPIPEAKWLAECYRITAGKDRRKGKNDLNRAIFLELIANDFKGAFVEDGFLVNSGKYSGLTSEKAREEITKWLEKNKMGRKETNYKLRDWCISRQRYWGPPIPVVYCEKCGTVVVPENDLPVKLPEMKKGWEPAGNGKGPLAKVESFMNATCPKCGGAARREADVMDNFLDSAWYFFRYVSPKNKKEIFDKKLGKKWLPVDLYVGGNEHAVLHLMYTRFITMTLHDLGLTNFDNPFKKFRANGMILKDGKKMSKSKGNVVNPEEYGEKLGYDALKSYLLFLGPLSEDRSFSDEGIRGLRHWAERVFNLKQRVLAGHKDSKAVIKKLHQTIKAVEDDMDNQKYNTAIAKLMELTNTLYGAQKISEKSFEKYLIIVSIFLPALAEEIWSQMGHRKSIFQEIWPKYDPKLARDEETIIVIQVNGKIRDQIQISADAKEDDIKKMAFESEKIKKYIPNIDNIKKIVFVPGRLINFVI